MKTNEEILEKYYNEWVLSHKLEIEYFECFKSGWEKALAMQRENQSPQDKTPNLKSVRDRNPVVADGNKSDKTADTHSPRKTDGQEVHEKSENRSFVQIGNVDEGVSNLCECGNPSCPDFYGGKFTPKKETEK